MEARWNKDVDGEEEETEVSHSLGVHEEKFKKLERAGRRGSKVDEEKRRREKMRGDEMRGEEMRGEKMRGDLRKGVETRRVQ